MPSKETSVTIRLWLKTKKDGDCRIWTGKTVGKTNGYGEIWYKGKGIRIGRLICHLYHGANLDDNNWTANHIIECKSSLCWNPEHLYVGTQHQNVQDQIKKGTFSYGTQNLNGGSNFNKDEWLRSKGNK